MLRLWVVICGKQAFVCKSQLCSGGGWCGFFLTFSLHFKCKFSCLRGQWNSRRWMLLSLLMKEAFACYFEFDSKEQRKFEFQVWNPEIQIFHPIFVPICSTQFDVQISFVLPSNFARKVLFTTKTYSFVVHSAVKTITR